MVDPYSTPRAMAVHLLDAQGVRRADAVLAYVRHVQAVLERAGDDANAAFWGMVQDEIEHELGRRRSARAGGT